MDISYIEFNLPIYYLTNKRILNENIKNDIEINNTNNSIYYKIFQPENKYAKIISEMWYYYYTTDFNFIKDSQYLIKNFKNITYINNIEKICQIKQELDNETGFYEKYKYLDSNYFKFLNNNPYFLHSLTLYNLTGPILNLLIPIIMIIIPFFIIKLSRKDITLELYIDSLKTVIKHHFIGKSLLEYNNVSLERKIFILFTTIMYFINIYQNFNSCFVYYKNLYKIKNYLQDIKVYIYNSINLIDNLHKYCGKSYNKFKNQNIYIKNQMILHYRKLELLELENFNIKDIGNVGNILYCFYQVYENKLYKNCIDYSLKLNGFINNIEKLNNLYKNKFINSFKVTNKNSEFNELYFAPLINADPIKNNIKLENNIIITGPNASGKTTILKSILFNIIFSQQTGMGFYKKAKINLYDYIHSYINIPDTSNRDSLFQAEARRCKNILDSIKLNNNVRHFCVFDELYSGTNPNEAISSGYGFLKFLNKDKNIDFILTTHYLTLCNILENEGIENKKMLVDKNNLYKITEGISNINGGIKILENLNYDKEIIDYAKNYLLKL